MYKNASWKARCMRGKTAPRAAGAIQHRQPRQMDDKASAHKTQRKRRDGQGGTKMKKRLIALLLAFVMVLGLTATVFAEGGISIASIQPEAPTHTYIFQAGG